MKRKAFTLVELLVVIAIIAMLLAILMPALNKVREMAYRMVCATNLSGMGKAMLTYSQDYEEEYPRAGTGGCEWDNVGLLGWTWDDPYDYPATNEDATVSASLYLLVKYGDVTPKQFICKATNDKKFDLSNYPQRSGDCSELEDAWDFGDHLTSTKVGPWDHVSYSYQWPYSIYSAHAASSPSLAIMADKNPWYDDDTQVTVKMIELSTDPLTKDEFISRDNVVAANSANHDGEGQNVLFNDIHVDWSRNPCAGLEEDNIYTPQIEVKSEEKPQAKDLMIGTVLTPGEYSIMYKPRSERDSFLVSDWIDDQ